MIPAAACPRITVTIAITETLYAALEVTAEMASTTVNAVVASALREKAIGTPRSRPIPAPQPTDLKRLQVDCRQPSGVPVIGSLQQAILDRLGSSEVCDLREVRRTLPPDRYRPSSVARAISRLIASGVLEPVCWSDGGFVPAREAQLRFVRRK